LPAEAFCTVSGVFGIEPAVVVVYGARDERPRRTSTWVAERSFAAGPFAAGDATVLFPFLI
jgi:hypothetical protein